MRTATASPTFAPKAVGYVDAGFKLAQMLRAMRARRLSGLGLQNASDRLLIGGE
jgi:hypothetical protein